MLTSTRTTVHKAAWSSHCLRTLRPHLYGSELHELARYQPKVVRTVSAVVPYVLYKTGLQSQLYNTFSQSQLPTLVRKSTWSDYHLTSTTHFRNFIFPIFYRDQLVPNHNEVLKRYPRDLGQPALRSGGYQLQRQSGLHKRKSSRTKTRMQQKLTCLLIASGQTTTSSTCERCKAVGS